MAIVDVMKLRKLRAMLVRWDWEHGEGLQCMRFFTDDGQRTSEKSLSKEQVEEIGRFLGCTEYSDSTISWCWSQAAGRALKEIVLRRLDLAIQEAAKTARKEAEEVLVELKES